jgi:Zn-dependent protease
VIDAFRRDIGTAVSHRRHRRSSASRGPGLLLAGLAVLCVIGAMLATSPPNSAWMATGVFDLVLAGWLISLAVHQFVQAWIAFWVGDESLLRQGYLGLNPLRHSDALLIVVMPTAFLLLGGVGMAMGAIWLVGTHTRRSYRTLAAVSGPAVHLAMALVLSFVCTISGEGTEAVGLRGALAYLALLQLMAAVLSLLPVPGLDGYELVSPWLPRRLTIRLDRGRLFGPVLLFVLLLPPPVNDALVEAVRDDLEAFGVAPAFVALGSDAFRFWQFHGM